MKTNYNCKANDKLELTHVDIIVIRINEGTACGSSHGKEV